MSSFDRYLQIGGNCVKVLVWLTLVSATRKILSLWMTFVSSFEVLTDWRKLFEGSGVVDFSVND